MVYAAAFAPAADADAVARMSFADSKALTEAVRDALFADIAACARLASRVESLSAAAISGAMLGRARVSLNKLASDATVALVQGALDAGANVAHVFVDTVGDAGRWAAALRARFPGLKFTGAPKADAKYPVVSAASIVAKVTRDRDVAALAAGVAGGAALGSGYPADPDTKAWLAAALHPVFGFPDCVRFSWQTTVRALEGGGAVVAGWEDDDDGVPAGQGTLAFGGAGSTKEDRAGRGVATSGAGRASYFRARRLAVAVL